MAEERKQHIVILLIARRVVLFLAFISILSVGFYFLNSYLFKKYKYQLPENTDVLICGPSLMRCGIDPDRLLNAVTIAQDAEMYPMSYIKLREVVENNPPPDHIMIAFSPGLFTYKLENYILSNPLFQKKIIDRLHPISSPSDYMDWGLEEKNVYINFYQYYCLPNLKYLGFWINGVKSKKKNRSPFDFIGKFRRVPISVLDSTKAVVIDQLTPKTEKEGQFSQLQKDGLQDIIDLCKKHDITLILVGIPIYHELRAVCPQPIVDRYKELRAEYDALEGVHVFDLSEHHIPDSMFYNASHLNLAGSEYTTDSLHSWMIKNDLYNLDL